MSLIETTLLIRASEGQMPVHVARPADAQMHPLILIYMDVNGIRAELKRFAARIAAAGYCVLLPDFYYRFGEGVHFDHTIPVHERPQADIDRLLAVMNALTDHAVLADTVALLEQVRREPYASQGAAGCVGYCMGGRHVMRAMTHLPQYFAAGAAHFPTYAVSEAADAPYRELRRGLGSFYFCFGARDNLITAGHVVTLRARLDELGSDYELTVHPNAGHGYAFSERRSGYDREAAEYDWQRTLALFARVLPPSSG